MPETTTRNIQIFIEALKKTDELKDVAKEIEAIRRGTKQTEQETARSSAAMARSFGVVTSSVTKLTAVIGGLAAAVGVVMLTRKLIDLGATALQTAAGFERMRISLDTLTRGAGEEWFRKLNEWALKMPMNTEQAIQTFIQLRAMGLRPTIQDMTTLVDATSALGGGAEVLNGIGRALGQMWTKGKASAEELRQLAEQGIPAYEILAQKLELSADQVANIGDHAISGRKAVEALIAGMAERFGGQAVKIQSTWDGMIETLRSYWKEFTREVFEAGPFAVMKQQAAEAVAFIDAAFESGKFKGWATETGQMIMTLMNSIVQFSASAFESISYPLQTLVHMWQGLTLSVQTVIMTITRALDWLAKVPRKIAESIGVLKPAYKPLIDTANALEMGMGGFSEQARIAMDETSRVMVQTQRGFDKARDSVRQFAWELNRGVKAAIEQAPEMSREQLLKRFMDQERGHTEDMKTELQKRAADGKRYTEGELAMIKNALKKEEDAYDNLLEKVRQVHKAMTMDLQAGQDRVRELEKAATREWVESQKDQFGNVREDLVRSVAVQEFFDAQKQAQKSLDEARHAALQGDLELARDLAKSAQAVGEKLAAGVDVLGPDGEPLISKAYGIKEAQKVLAEANKIIKDAWQEQKDAAEETLRDQAEKVEPLRKTWEDLTAQLKEYESVLASLKDTPAEVWAELKGLDEIKRQLDEVTQPRTVTVTYRFISPPGAPAAQETQATGGPVGFAAGGWARIFGKLGGYGGGDQIRALLERGEWVIRKEAVRHYGNAFLSAVNQMRLPIPRLAAGGPVLRGKAGAAYMGRLELALPGGDSLSVFTAFDESAKLERIFQRIRKTTR